MVCMKASPAPGCQGPGKPAACSVCSRMTAPGTNEVAARFAALSAAVRSRTYSRFVGQRCGGVDAAWQTQYTLSTTPSGTVLTVTVAIHAADGTASATPSVKATWASRVAAAWNNKAQISVPVYATATATAPATTVTRKVVFAIEWVDGLAGSPYDVTCNRSRTAREYMAYFDGLSDAERNALILVWRASRPELQNYQTTDPEWKKLNFLNDVPRDHNRHGTPNLGVWGDADAEAVQHEFGHAIGLPDEYDITEFATSADGTTWTDVPISAAVYDRPAFTTKSLMNNTMSREARVHPRHFMLLMKDFEHFVATTLGVTGVVKPGRATVKMVG
jgi:hypothetical protein